MLQLNNKTLTQVQIALKLDEYDYDKDTQAYFEKMPSIGLLDSQVYFVNQYIDILENCNGDLKWDFEDILNGLIQENEVYQRLLEDGSTSRKIKQYANNTAYLIRQLKKYQAKY
ncbi:MAG: hypothetical protein IJH71_08105 [Eubacterium sp.]|nr:hypothetical protein [Eubacterium sp.]